jgi:hypothetical protein
MEVMALKRRKRIRLLPSMTLSKTASTLASPHAGGEVQGLGDDGEGDAEEASDAVGAVSDDPVVAEEDRVLGFTWDGKGRFQDAAKLTAIYRELEYADNQCNLYLDRLGDELLALQGIYRTLMRHKYETEAYIRSYTGHIRALNAFLGNRAQLLPAKSIKG